MKRFIRYSPFARLATLAVGLLTLTSTASASGLLLAEGPFGGRLEIMSHDVDVMVNNGIAVTQVEQVFRNTEDRIVEALYVFPVPNGASVADFSMWINGKEMVGEVLEKKRAREIYESYKQTRVDPGLLEQVDYRTFEMRIFPIAAGAEQRVRITYYQELNVDHDTATYVYPLATNAIDGTADTQVQGRFSFSFAAKAEVPITALESPSHPDDFAMEQPAGKAVAAELELVGGDLSRDVVLHLTAERPMTGIDVIANRVDGEDGYFQLTLTAGKELEAKAEEGMDYIFVLDVSGSMRDDRKLQLSTTAAGTFVGALGENDRFEVITFNNTLETLFGELRSVDDVSQSAATTFLDDQRAAGGTRLRQAFEAAYRYAADPDRAVNVVVLSDGLGEQRAASELVGLISQRPGNVRVFCVGVGNDVNRPLLEQVADRSGGLAAFISPQDDMQRVAQAFRRKLTRPVASDIALKFDGADVYDLVPAELPALYHGSPVRVYGRYRDAGTANLAFSANVMGQDVTSIVPLDLPEESDVNPEIERMWAWHRIDELLKTDDRNGGRSTGTVNEIVRLGEAFSIVSEYTSFIVLENDAEYQRWNIERRNVLRLGRDRVAQQRVREAFEQLRDQAARDIGPVPQQLAAATPAGNRLVPQAEPQMQAPAQPQSMPLTNNRDSRRDITFAPQSTPGGGGGSSFGLFGVTMVLAAAGVGRIATRRLR